MQGDGVRCVREMVTRVWIVRLKTNFSEIFILLLWKMGNERRGSSVGE